VAKVSKQGKGVVDTTGNLAQKILKEHAPNDSHSASAPTLNLNHGD
jgi:hypothetical protein